MTPPINIDGTQITGASIDGQDVSAITVDGTEVFSAFQVANLVDNRWKLDEGTGTTASDSVGSTSASLTNISWTTNSKYSGGEAVVMSGDDSLLTDSEVNINDSKGEILFWVDSMDIGGNSFATICAAGPSLTGTTTNPSDGYRLQFDSSSLDGLIVDFFSGGSSTRPIRGTISETVDTDDYLFCLRVDGDTAGLRVYKGTGTKVGDLSGTGTRGTSASADLQWGDEDNGGPDATLDDVMAVHGATLTESEEADIANETAR